MSTLSNYQTLTRIDSLTMGIIPEYPFRLNEEAQFTQHQIELYRDNFCFTERKDWNRENNTNNYNKNYKNKNYNKHHYKKKHFHKRGGGGGEPAPIEFLFI